MLWIGGNDNDMYTTNGPTNCEHDVGALVLTISFFYFIGVMYLQSNISHKIMMEA